MTVATVTGSLRAKEKADFSGCRITASYTTSVDPVTGDPGGTLTAPATASAAVDASGGWTLQLPDKGITGTVELNATAPSGIRIGSKQFAAGTVPAQVDLDAAAVVPLVATPSSDPTLGRSVSLTGRVLNPDGSGAPAGLLVILWGRLVSNAPTPPSPVPVLAAMTSDGGYFSDAWPTGTYASGYGTVAAADPITVPLVDQRFPTTVVLVASVPLEPSPRHDHEDGCACTTTPSRVPSQAELTANPSAYSADAGGGRCVDFTVPNRTLEEVTFHAVVRTTEPEIKGVQLPDPTQLAEPLVSRLRMLSTERNAAPAGDGGGAMAAAGSLRLHPEVIADQMYTGLAVGPPSEAALLRADQLSKLKLIGELVTLLGSDQGDRVTLDAGHLVQWDDHPVSYEATTVAIGHLLTLKQVWRADGYSLGDLLYSLPLAPGQKKQLATIDWDRRETAARQATRQANESLDAVLVHDRDVSDIINSALTEHDRGESSASVSAVGGGIGGFIGPVVFGGGAASSSASSTAHAHNARDVTASALNQAQDRTSQAANSVRSQRITVVQSARQGESMRVQTDVVANHNHCHAITMEYFEVLRHFQVSVELADVQECLFVPLAISPFTPAKALRWRGSLMPALSRGGSGAGL